MTDWSCPASSTRRRSNVTRSDSSLETLQNEFSDNNFYRPKQSFGQGNIFRSVCHSVHRGVGGGLVPGRSPIFRGGFLQILGGPSNFFGGGRGVPPIFLGGRGSSKFFWGEVPPNFCGVSNFFWGGVLHQNMVNIRLVRILLECILVVIKRARIYHLLC